MEFKAFSASTSSIAYFSLDLNNPCIAYITASHPVSLPAHNCEHSVAFLVFSLITFITTFSEIHLRTSQNFSDNSPMRFAMLM